LSPLIFFSNFLNPFIFFLFLCKPLLLCLTFRHAFAHEFEQIAPTFDAVLELLHHAFQLQLVFLHVLPDDVLVHEQQSVLIARTDLAEGGLQLREFLKRPLLSTHDVLHVLVFVLALHHDRLRFGDWLETDRVGLHAQVLLLIFFLLTFLLQPFHFYALTFLFLLQAFDAGVDGLRESD